MKHVVQTSVLSTKWRYIWTSLPFLNFDCKLFCSNGRNNGKFFIRFVDDVLLLGDTSSNIQSFRLSGDPYDNCDVKNRLNSWILVAIRRNVQQLYLNIFVKRDFQWPTCLFTCRSLTTLELTGIVKLSLPDSMSLPRLKTLIFFGVEFVGVDIPNEIFSSCPVLESLVIRYCEFDQTNLNFYALKLKHLVIEEWANVPQIWKGESTIKFNVPNLISFGCKGYLWEGYHIENLSVLDKADIDMDVVGDENEMLGSFYDGMTKASKQLIMKFLRVFHNAKDITLSERFLKNVSRARALIERKPNQYSNLRCLKLHTYLSRTAVNAITFFLKISPNIESLLLEMKKDSSLSNPNYPYWDEVTSNSTKIKGLQKAVLSQCMLYHLKLVKIRGVEGRLNELIFLEVLLKNSSLGESCPLHF